ncbi:MAG: NAD(P)H-dependent oxidoreductase, partial [Mycobacteriaceae bacterium]|nr:NAD(P)H-dependent oxidoreductase [Mycobacteriaceae bacterium]
ALRAELAAADAVVFCTPEYAGTLPGSLKNLLDWTVGNGDLHGKPAAWINVAADPRRGGGATETLALVLGYVDAVVIEAACLRIPVSQDIIGPDGVVADAAARDRLAAVLRTVAAYPV